MATHRLGSNLVLASVLALLSYVPYEYVAKFTLIVSVLLFVFDPIPPLTRLLALGMTCVLLVLTRLLRNWEAHQLTEGNDGEPEEGAPMDGQLPSGDGTTENKKID